MNAAQRTTKLDLNAAVIGSDRYFLAFSLLFIALIIIYANSFHAEFHYDDFPNIVQNPNLKMETLSWGSVKASISDVRAFDKIKRPLPYLSFALNYFFHRTDVFGYHVVNFSIHFLTAIFLFLFTKNMLELPSASPFFRNYSYPIALLSSFLWSTHPIQVTAVTYIVQRMASMAGMFYIMSMFFYLKARTSPIRGRTALWTLICVITGLCALGSKENAAILPLSLLLFDYIFFHNEWTEINRNKALIAVFSILLVGFIASQLVNPFSILEGYQRRPFTLAERLLTQPRVIVLYLWLLIYPVSANFTLIHDISISTGLLSPWTTFPAILAISSLLVAVFWLMKRWPVISFSIFFYLLNHIVESSVLPLELIYEHRNYIPSFFFFIPTSVLILWCFHRFYPSRVIFGLLFGVVTFVIVSSAHTTYLYNGLFRTEYSLWQDAFDKSPNRKLVQVNYATALLYRGRLETALQLLNQAKLSEKKAANLRTESLPYHNLAQYYFSKGELRNAMELFKHSLRFNALPRSFNGIAKIHYLNGKFAEAKKYIGKALSIAPDSAPAYRTLSLIYLRENRIDAAMKMAWRAIQINQGFAPPYYILGEAFKQKKDIVNSERNYKKYLSMRPDDVNAMLSLIDILAIKEDIHLMEHHVFRLMSSISRKEVPKILQRYQTYANFNSPASLERITVNIRYALDKTSLALSESQFARNPKVLPPSSMFTNGLPPILVEDY